jgi:hypothetical protein
LCERVGCVYNPALITLIVVRKLVALEWARGVRSGCFWDPG